MRKRVIFFLIMSAFVLLAANGRPGPHPVYAEIRNASNEIPAEGDITFQAWLLSNPNEILDENTTDCYYPAFGSYVKVNCGQFSTWYNTDILHLEVTEISTGDTGSGDFQLSYDASQFFSIENGGIYLGNAGGPPEIELPDEFNLLEDEILEENFSDYITGIWTQLTASGNENIAIEIAGSTVSFIPVENWYGSEAISFEVTGLEGDTVSDEVNVIVSGVNDAPELNFPQQLQFNEDGSFSEDISSYASDIEGDELSFFAESSEHITAEINGTILEMSASADWNGMEFITISVSDDQTRAITEVEVPVVVNPMNDAPVIDLPEQMTFMAGSDAEVDFSPFMEDIDGDVLDITYYGEDDLSVEVDGSVVSFGYTAGWHGSDEIVFTVNDNAMRVTDSDTMQVNIFYPEDTVLSCDDYEIDDGDELEVAIHSTEFFEEWSQVSFTMEFNYNPQVLQFTDYNLDGTIIQGGTISVEEEEPGELEINYLYYLPITGAGDLLNLEFSTVCHGESALDIGSCIILTNNLTNLEDGYVLVNDIGLEHPPVADAGADFGVLSGGTGTLDGSGSYDPDGDAITWLWDAPAEIVLDDATSSITGFTAPIVTEDTEYIITLTVSDGENSSSDLVTVTVNYQNHAPEMTLPEEFIFEEDSSLTEDFSEYVTDLDGDELTLSVAGNENVIVQIDELMVEFLAEENWSGTETLTFTVGDGVVNDVSDEVIITVNGVNDPPHADAGMDISARDGETVVLDGSASWDVETTELEYIWIAPAGIMLDDPYAQSPSFTAPQVVDPEEYEFTLQVSDGEITDEDMVTVTIQDDEPVLLNIELQAENNALFTWAAPGSGGSGQEIEQGFEGIIPPQGWLNIDNDEDGYGWYIYSVDPHSGSSSLGSQSYSPSQGPLTPDNWFISPPLQIGALSVLNYWIGAQDEFYPGEHYSVLISTESAGIDDFQEVLIEETLEDNSWQERNFSLENWAGETIYIAWRHHDVTNQFILKLDDVQVLNSSTREVLFDESFEVQVEEKVVQAGLRDRELLGYNVFLDQEMEDFVDIQQYTFQNVVGPHQAGVQAVYDNGVSEIVTIDFDHTAAVDDLPLATQLGKIYPNPFNPVTKIEFSLLAEQLVDVSIYNIRGQKVETLLNERVEPGYHSLIWQAEGKASGIYFLIMKTENYSSKKKLLLMK